MSQDKEEGLGASASPTACSPTAEPPVCAGVSSASPLRPTGAVGFGGRTYSAKGGTLHVEPLRREHPDGRTGFTLGFPLAEIDTDICGDVVPAALAEYLSCPKRAAAPDLYEALSLFVREYVELVESGDAGFWDAEQEEKVIKARAALSKAEGR